jgi:arabinofuranan 3-O-arabinosyltransferase
LEPGWHDLVAGGGRQPDMITLATGAIGNDVSASEPVAKITASSRWDGGYSVSVQDARDPYYLVIGQNFDPRWKASIDGKDLGPPQLLDGYSAGWRIARVGSYSVTVRYGPQRLYTFALLVSAATFLLALAIITISLVVRVRRRAKASVDPGHAST